jgi:hypothetical protein
MRPQRIKTVLKTTLRKLGLDKRIKECTVLPFWNDAVGETIALHTRPIKVSGGRMTVLVESPSWTQELTFMKTRIIKELNSRIGKEIVKDIYFKIGNIRKLPPKEKKQDLDLAKITLTKETRGKIMEHLKTIEDPEIKKVLEDFLTKEAKYEILRNNLTRRVQEER